MLDVFIQDHIKKIKSEFSPRSLIVYKGLPLSFIKKISKEFKLLTSLETILTDNRLNLEKIRTLSKGIIKKLLELDNNIYLMTYEEFIAVTNNINLSIFDFPVVIVNNNLHVDFPSNLLSHFHNIDEVVEKEDFSYKEDEIFNYFYAYSSMRFGMQLVNYKDIDQTLPGNVKSIDFFDKEIVDAQTLELKEVEDSQIKPDDILLTESDEKYFKLKYSIYQKVKFDNPTIIITDPVSIKHSYLEQELKILKAIYSKNDKEILLRVVSNNAPSKYRAEFKEILKKYWGSDDFRQLIFYKDPDISNDKYITSQGNITEEIIEEVEKALGNKDFRDIFITAPTGAGKSVLFQIPAIYIAEKYNLVSIIVSPLKALMYDQVRALKAKGINKAAYINSDISLIERENIVRDIKNGKISILYLSPELLLSYDVRQFIGDRKVGLLVIDEAHLVTTWGRDFRVDYWYLGTYIKRLRKYIENSKFPVLGLTATAVYTGPDDIVFQTTESLNMRTPKLHIGNVRRNEIEFNIRKFDYVGNHEVAKIENTMKFIINNVKQGKKAIVYFPWINQIKLVINQLPDEIRKKVGAYYGDVDKTEKQIVQDQFQVGDITVVLATKAFGMGIDVSDIEIIYHHAPSGSLSDYIQEVGRVARKKDVKGLAITDFNDKDLKFTKILYGLSSIKQYQVKLALQKINDLYEINKNRQMLISVEDFGFIFSSDEKGYETKVKSALLLLERDLQLKVNNQYNVIMVRPKAVFSIVYACIPLKVEERFLKKYGRYCRMVTSIKSNAKRDFRGSTIEDTGNIYQIDLNKIWEKYFNKESFPMVKRKFFERTLFNEFTEEEQPMPRYQLKILLNVKPSQVLIKLENYFNILDKVFHHFRDTTFSDEELRLELTKGFGSEVLSRRVTNLITNLYAAVSDYGEIGQSLSFDTFLQTKRDNTGTQKYRLVSNKYMQVKPMIMRKFKSMFENEDLSFEKYIAVGESGKEYRIKIAYLIESFLLGHYEISGGQLSQIFIRINEPYKLKLFSSQEDYNNVILRNVELRHQRSVETMSQFFNLKMTNDERWDYIENYFLGKSEDNHS